MSKNPDPLLPRVADGDESAMREAISRYGNLIWSLTRRMCRDRVESEDAVQEIFISIWQNAHRFDESIASEVTFIATIARRRLIDRLRGRKPVTPDSDIAGDAGESSPPGGDLELKEDAATALEAFRELRPEQQKVLELSIGRGMTQEQISEVTGMPLGTVKTHTRRGLIRIRELLEKEPSGSSMGASSS